jgi:hypothetical protein
MDHSEASIGDELLSAWLDDELAPADRQQVSAALAAQPALARRLEQLRLANDLTRQHASLIDALPLPAQLHTLLAPDQPVPASTAQVLTWRTRVQQWRHFQPVSVAASLVLALVLSYSLLLEQDSPVGASDHQAALLAEVLSGETLDLGELVLTPRFSFRSIGGQWCRLYRVEAPTLSLDNIACLDGDIWRQQASLPAKTADGAQYLPASATAGTLDAALDALMQGVPLPLDAETRLILTQWSTAD